MLSDCVLDDPLQSTSKPVPIEIKEEQEDAGDLSQTPIASFPTPKQQSTDPSNTSLASKNPTSAQIHAICEACSTGSLSALEEVLRPLNAPSDHPDSFSLVNCQNPKTSLTPLHYASTRGHVDIVQALLEAGAIIMEDNSGENPLHLAALKGHLAILKLLVNATGPETAAAQDFDGWTPLHNACSKGFLHCVKYLIEDVQVPADCLSKFGYTPLMNAAGKGALPIVNYLLTKRLVDPFQRSIHGETAYDVGVVSEVFVCEQLAQHECLLWEEKQTDKSIEDRVPYNPLALHVSCACLLHENQSLDLRLLSLGNKPTFTAAAITKSDNRSPFTLPPSFDGINSTPYHLPVYRSDVGLPTTHSPFQIVLPQIALQYIPQQAKKKPDMIRTRTLSGTVPSRRTPTRSFSAISAHSEASVASNSSYFAANASLPVTAATERSHFWISEWFIDLSSPRVDPSNGWEYARSFDDDPSEWVSEPPLELQRLLEQTTSLSTASNKWVRRRRWIRVMRRRLDRSGLPFADLDGPESLLQSSNGSHNLEHPEQELADFSPSSGADYVTRARFKAGVHHRLSSNISDTVSVKSGGSVPRNKRNSKSEAQRLILRLESAISELRIGLLEDDDVERAQQASALLETYVARLEEIKSQSHLNTTQDGDVDAGQEPEEFTYPSVETEDHQSIHSTDYFNSRDTSVAQNRPPDLTPDLRQASNFRVPTSDSPIVRITSTSKLPTAVSVLPKWERDDSVNQCRRCSSAFTFLKRRHHCRKCGLVVCGPCSNNMDALDPSEVVLDPEMDVLAKLSIASMRGHRTCDPCHEEVIAREARPAGSPSGLMMNADLLSTLFEQSAHSTSPGSPLASSIHSQVSILTECPVCSFPLNSLASQHDQEEHVRRCLDSGRKSATQNNRYLVFKLAQSTSLEDQECEICFETFETGQELARMPCFCHFHANCLRAWLKRSHGCPLHERD